MRSFIVVLSVCANGHFHSHLGMISSRNTEAQIFFSKMLEQA